MLIIPVEQSVLDAFLSLGGWSDTADEELGLGEQLPRSFVSQLVAEYKADPHNRAKTVNLGLLVLATAVAEWGVKPPSELPTDPQNDNWEGPNKSRGKHLMSYTVGGIGIAHADVGYLSHFVSYLATKQTKIFSPAEVELLNDLAVKLSQHTTYDDLRNAGGPNWEAFKNCMRTALRVRDAQAWLIGYFLGQHWLPSYDAVVTANVGTVEEAFINARIRNSGSALAACAFDHARKHPAGDAIAAELDAYIDPKICVHANPRHNDRVGYMMRPVIIHHSS
jgi:hypothetical protein